MKNLKIRKSQIYLQNFSKCKNVKVMGLFVKIIKNMKSEKSGVYLKIL